MPDDHPPPTPRKRVVIKRTKRTQAPEAVETAPTTKSKTKHRALILVAAIAVAIAIAALNFRPDAAMSPPADALEETQVQTSELATVTEEPVADPLKQWSIETIQESRRWRPADFERTEHEVTDGMLHVTNPLTATEPIRLALKRRLGGDFGVDFQLRTTQKLQLRPVRGRDAWIGYQMPESDAPLAVRLQRRDKLLNGWINDIAAPLSMFSPDFTEPYRLVIVLAPGESASVSAVSFFEPDSIDVSITENGELLVQASKDLNLQGPLHSFEEKTIAKAWQVRDGTFSISNKRYKSGRQSLSWLPQSAGASLTYQNPVDFAKLKPFHSKRGGSTIGFWLHLQEPVDGVLTLELLSGETTIGTAWYDLRYQGWRPLGAAYSHLGWKPGTTITGVRFTLPDVDTEVALDLVTFNMIGKGPSRDWQQPWSGSAERLSQPADSLRLDPNDLTVNRPWLAPFSLRTPAAAELDGLNQLRKLRLPNPPKKNVGSAKVNEWRQQLANWRIRRTDGAISGIPIQRGGSFLRPPEAIDLMAYNVLWSAVSNAIENGNEEVDQLYVDLTEHFLDQGWAVGNNNMGGPGGGYDVRAWPQTVLRGRRLLKRHHLADRAAKAVFWFMNGRGMVNENVHASTDSQSNVDHHALTALLALSDEQALQYLQAFRRFSNRALTNNALMAPDGTVHHHWMHHYAYASYSVPQMVRTVSHLTQANYRLDPEVYHRLGQYVHAHAFMSAKHAIPPNLNGRAGTGMAFNGASLARQLADLGSIDGSDPINKRMAALYLTESGNNPNDAKAANYVSTGISPLALTGHWTLNGTAAALHRRKSWLVAVDGMRNDHRGFEIYGWLESNNYARSVCNGSIFVYGANQAVTARESGFDLAGWNWSHWPGTTALVQPSHELYHYYTMYGNRNSLAGGTTLDQDGIWGMDFHSRGNVTFKKSVFCFDNRVTVLTTHINSSKNKPTATTLFQLAKPKVSKPILINGRQAEAYVHTQKLPANQQHWLMDDRGTGYVIPPQSAPIHVEGGTQSWLYATTKHLKDSKDNPHVKSGTRNSWRHPDMRDNEAYYKPTTGEFTKAWFDHGQNPKDQALSYTMLVETTPTDLTAYAKTGLSGDQPDQILQRDGNAHVMKDRPSNTICAVVFTAKCVINQDILKSVDRPGFVMLRQNLNGTVTLSICSTDAKANKAKAPIVLSLHKQWTLASQSPQVALSTTDASTTLSITTPDYMPIQLLLRPADK